VENIFATSSEPCSTVWHQSFTLRQSNFAAQIGFAGLAELALL
jgi:hypothetical protein